MSFVEELSSWVLIQSSGPTKRCSSSTKLHKHLAMKPATAIPFTYDCDAIRHEAQVQICPKTDQSPTQNIFCHSELPATFRTTLHTLERPDAGNVDFLKSELGLDRLNAIHDWLFVVGRPMPARPLHQQRIMRRETVLTEQPDLHLVWAEGRIFIKPLPRYLLDPSFWRLHLTCKTTCCCTDRLVRNDSGSLRVCEQQSLFLCANGLLYSYVSLISHESDFHLAKAQHLIPDSITWPSWVILVSQLLDPKNPCRRRINRRYFYGELRLSRLNDVYRFRKGFLIRGYLYNYRYDKYLSFLRLNLGRIFALGAYMVIILNAMQVGLSTQMLADNHSFQRAAYGFVVLSILGPIILLLSAVVAFFGIMLWNLIITRRFHQQRLRVGVL